MREEQPLAANPLLTLRDLRALHAAAYGWARRCCHGDAEDAADVLQTTYLYILDGRARFSGRSSLRTWLFGVLRNIARQSLRRRLRAAAIGWRMPAESIEEGPDSCADASDARHVWRHWMRLPRRQREVLELVFYRDFTLDEVAAIIGISPGSARVHYERGKARLRRLLAQRNGEG
ncbi:MAG: sigma-70 family RNA polymerase sigma factor [Steroidobacteraceae bacterium]